MGLIGLVIVGFFIGLVARALMPGNNRMGFLLTSALGILGSVVVGFLGQQLGGFYCFGIRRAADYGGGGRHAPLACRPPQGSLKTVFPVFRLPFVLSGGLKGASAARQQF